MVLAMIPHIVWFAEAHFVPLTYAGDTYSLEEASQVRQRRQGRKLLTEFQLTKVIPAFKTGAWRKAFGIFDRNGGGRYPVAVRITSPPSVPSGIARSRRPSLTRYGRNLVEKLRDGSNDLRRRKRLLKD
jgi:hypothetical protein